VATNTYSQWREVGGSGLCRYTQQHDHYSKVYKRYGTQCIIQYVTEFWKITHMGVPETIRIFEFSMALLIAETTLKNISKLYL